MATLTHLLGSLPARGPASAASSWLVACLSSGSRNITTKGSSGGGGTGGPEPPKSAGAQSRPPPPPSPPSELRSSPRAAPTVAGTPGPATPPAGTPDYNIVLKLAHQFAKPGGAPLERGSAGRLSGVYKVDLAPHRVLIISHARSPEQQGRQNTSFNKSMPHWSIEFLDPVEHWDNGLMGWTSSADTMDQAAVALQFYSAEEAVAFCERQGWLYEIEEPHEPRADRGRRWATYGDNFSVKEHGLPDLSHLPSERRAGGGGGSGEHPSDRRAPTGSN